jgi:phage shock protein A
MGIFDRLSGLLKSNLNDLISSAENPEKMLNQIIIDMRTSSPRPSSRWRRASQTRSAQGPGGRRVQALGRLGEARDARVQEGRDDLAKQALLRGQEHLEHAQQLATTWSSTDGDGEAQAVAP